MTTLFDINVHKGDIGGRKNDYLYGIEEHQNAPQQVGETFKEYRNVTPYKFNGKELDQVHADQSAVMTRSIHSAQNDFLSSNYTKMAAGLIGGMMVGPAALEGGIAVTKAAYGAILPHVPYYAMEGVSTFNEVKSMMEWAGWMLSEIENSTLMSFSVGFFDGVYKFLYNAPPDSPYLFSNPLFQFSSDLINGLLMFLKK